MLEADLDLDDFLFWDVNGRNFFFYLNEQVNFMFHFGTDDSLFVENDEFMASIIDGTSARYAAE